MRSRSVLLLVVALGCGVVASVAVSQVVLNQNERQEVRTVNVLVASKNLSAALKVPLDGFRVEQWPADRVPYDAITDPKMIENKFLKQRLYIGEPFIEAKLSSKGKEFSVPVGFRIFDIPVRDDSGGGGYIGPGDRVDVFGYFAGSSRISSAKSVKVIENLEVVMVDGVAVVDPEITSLKKSSTIQLLVKDSQYIVLDTAANLGKLRLALCPPEQVMNAPGLEDNGEEFMEWLNQSESSKVNVDLPVAEVVQVPVERKSKTDQYEMTIISSTKSTRYRMVNGQMVPQREGEVEFGVETSAEAFPGAGAAYRPPQPTISEPPVNPNADAQPNLVWDAVSGVWQSGGFKATYPSGK